MYNGTPSCAQLCQRCAKTYSSNKNDFENKTQAPIFTSSTGMPVRESIFVQTNIGASESPFHGNHKLMQAASIKSTYQMLRAVPNANKDMYTAGYETMESMSKLVDNMRKSSIAVEKEINDMMMEEFSSKYNSEIKVKEIHDVVGQHERRHFREQGFERG